MTLLYNGQEKAVSHAPSLFDRDTVKWNAAESVDLTRYIARLSYIKSDPVFADCSYKATAPSADTLVALREHDGKKMLGVFPLKGESGLVRVEFEDGVYENLISGEAVEVFRGTLSSCGKPVILRNF